jgi:hypothetical protein
MGDRTREGYGMHADELLDDDHAEVRRLVRAAFDRNPHDGWTPQRLATTLGLPVVAVGRALGELSSSGLILQIDGEYVPAFAPD